MKNLISYSPLRTALAGTLILGLAASSAAAQSLIGQHGEVLLAQGDNAPGLPSVTIYSVNSTALDTPVIDQNGYCVFRARLAGAVSANDDRAIFAGNCAADLGLVVRAGDQAPGLAAGIFLRSNTSGAAGPNANVQVSPSNRILYFSSALSDGGVNVTALNDSALFWGPAGGLSLLAREGDPVSFLPGTSYGPLSSFSRQNNTINALGEAVFTCALTGAVTAGDDLIMIVGSPTSVQKVIREGDDLDGMGGTVAPQTSTSLSFSSQINDAGQILLDIELAGTATTTNNSALAVFTPGSGTSIIVREGTQAPSLPAGISLFGGPGRGGNSWNNSGNTAFFWAVDDGGVTITAANDRVLFYGGTAPITKVVQEGESTGLPGGETFGNFNNASLTSNPAGTIAFFDTMRDSAGMPLPTTSDSAMFYGTAGNWTALVREGDVITAIPASVNGPWLCGSVTGSTNLNENGQLLFNQSASDGVNSQTFYLVYDPTTGLKVVQDGSETYTTTLGTGTATSASTGGSQSGSGGSPNWFNNVGDFVVRLGIDNGLQGAIVKGHSGSLIASPSCISATAGGTQTFTIDAGPSNAIKLYAVLGTQSGTSPGTVLPPLGPLTIPLVFDAWTDLSIALINTSVYTNTLGITDIEGRAVASFNLPPSTGIGTFELHHAVLVLNLNLTESFVTEPAALRIN